MKESKYILKSPALKGELIFTYDENGIIKEFIKAADLTDKQLAWLNHHFPVTMELLKQQIKGTKSTLTKVDPDLSFDAFWGAYAHKVGNKRRAKRLWDDLSKEDRIKALAYIKKYNRFLANNPGISKLYPETYLNQQRWNN